MSTNELGTLESRPFRETLGEDSPFILRTRSAEMATDAPLEDDDISTTATSLHSSFDAALLGSEEQSSQIFRGPPRVSMALSWDEGHSEKGRKHFLPPHHTVSGGADLVPPTTVRKQPRSDAVQTPARPLRLPPGSAVKARTPSSSSRRRKAAPLHHRKCKSPFHQRASPSSTPARPPFPVRETGFLKDSPFHSTPAPYHPSQTKASRVQTCNTATTANETALDITIDTEPSHESPVSTPFRFTSFPASLPRVHPAEKQNSATRKKACFSQSQLDHDATVMKRARPMNVMTEESAQNSSLSSMSEQGMQPHSFPPSVLEWKSPHGNKTLQSKFSDDSETDQARQSVVPSGLFLDNSGQYSYSSDESPIRVNVPRTRLNFNVVMSPTNGHEDVLLEESKPASVPHASPALRPSSPTPASPAEVLFREELDAAQCSPILPHKETEFCDASPLERPLSPVEEAPPATRSSSKLSLSQESSISSSSSSKQRRLRPMPDMSAFDARASMRSLASSLNDKSDDTPPSPKLTCPPTPVRTPAWAHGDSAGNPFVRANSLILTKVLATCPVNVVHAPSLSENCAMEDENEVEKRRASLSFSTVDEEMEDMSGDRHSSTDSSTPPPRADLFSTGVPLQELTMNPNVAVAHRTGKAIAKASSSASNEDGASVSFARNFDNLGQLGSGAFADVYKVRSKEDCQYYAVKRNRRQFRGKRDRDMAMTEVRTMQKLQSACSDKDKPPYNVYVLFFYRAWQEEGYFHCQTELCCRDTCRELMDSLRCKWPSAVTMYPSLTRHLDAAKTADSDDGSLGRLVPDATVWKIVHDVAAGLSHIHSHGIAHHDIKPSNIFFVSHAGVGAMCKIGDFGMAGEIGTAEDGQEGDTVYMPPELLSSSAKQPGADIFSLGLTIYELASSIGWEMPVEGPRWHELRDGSHTPELHASRHADLAKLIQATIHPDPTKRPSADHILTGLPLVKEAGSRCDEFLRDYLRDVEQYDRVQERRMGPAEQTPRNMEQQRELRTPTPGIPLAPLLFTPNLGGSDKAI